MTNLWQNLHDFYTQKFPNLQVFGQNYTKNHSQNQDRDFAKKIKVNYNDNLT